MSLKQCVKLPAICSTKARFKRKKDLIHIVDLQLRLRQTFKPVSIAIEQRRIPGAVLGVVDRDANTAIAFDGLAQSIPNRRQMQSDTWFDLASLTKVLFTTPAILQYSSDGAFDLDDPLTRILPDLRQYDAQCWERQITFRDCLSHRTPLPAVEPLYTYGQSPELLRAFILQREWRKSDPVYSDINFILLGFALERLKGCAIMDMDPGTGFRFSADADNCAATEHCTWRNRVLCGEVHDDNCSALKGAGHAGLFGTANAVLHAAHRILTADPEKDPIVRLMRTPVTDGFTHGWMRASTNWSGGELCGSNAIGHTGFTGTGVWIDFDSGLAWTLLTNRIHPTRHVDSGIGDLRRQVGRLLLEY